jgi:hypothetical protein
VPGAAVADSVCGWRDQGPGLWGLCLLGCGVIRAPFLFLSWLEWVLHLFVGRGCADDMTPVRFLEVFSSPVAGLYGVGEWGCGRLSGQRGVDIVHALSTGGSSARIVMPSSWLCLHYFMKFSVLDGKTSRPRSPVSLDVPGSAGTSLGYRRLWRPSRR